MFGKKAKKVELTAADLVSLNEALRMLEVYFGKRASWIQAKVVSSAGQGSFRDVLIEGFVLIGKESRKISAEMRLVREEGWTWRISGHTHRLRLGDEDYLWLCVQNDGQDQDKLPVLKVANEYGSYLWWIGTGMSDRHQKSILP